MKSLLLLLAIVCATAPGKGRKHFIHDLENVLSKYEQNGLDSLFNAHEQRTGNEVVLVTHPNFDGMSALDFAVAYGDSLSVGKVDHHNGVVIAFSKALREVFIATGHGTHQVMPDSICKQIVDRTMLPHFKEERHFDGLWAGGLAVVEFLERPENRIQLR